MRMLVLLRWSEQFHEVESWKSLQENIEVKDRAWNGSIEKLFQTDDIVKQAKELVFDLPTAIDVFTTESYNRLPEIIQFVIFLKILKILGGTNRKIFQIHTKGNRKIK